LLNSVFSIKGISKNYLTKFEWLAFSFVFVLFCLKTRYIRQYAPHFKTKKSLKTLRKNQAKLVFRDALKKLTLFIAPPPFFFSINQKRRRGRRAGAFAPATPFEVMSAEICNYRKSKNKPPSF